MIINIIIITLVTSPGVTFWRGETEIVTGTVQEGLEFISHRQIDE